MVFRHDDSVGHHSDDSVGPFRYDTSVCRSQRGSFSGSQSIIRLNMYAYLTRARQPRPAQICFLAGLDKHSRNFLGAQIQKLKVAKELSGQLSQKFTNTEIPSCSSYTSNQVA
ncbi:hypothetical protein F511_35469 [Dorcoceras hygrometricum]|uniref:Uncharacterized protein n=1 Tax=Dorcoceras hygrometricum TaxID=472368 RepID=A0A2Z7CCM1_9LAMI|nr:hypothetical protein F511_35469 [Dorcoceras hygrometricum]